MSETPILPPGDEEACSRFQAAWLLGDPPALEDYLPPNAEARRRLLRRLLAVECYHRHLRGEAVDVERYRALFPAEADLIDEVLGPPPAGSATTLSLAGRSAVEPFKRFQEFLAEGVGEEPLPAELARQLDEVCGRFEEAWATGGSPRLDDFLDGWGPPARAPLLRELIRIDAEQRRLRGQDCSLAEYRRFPEVDPVWLAEELATPPLPAAQSAGFDQTPTAYPGGPGAPLAGPPVSGYELLGILGRGGMGVVYKARQVALNRVVALKMMRPEVLADADAMARFRLEAQALASLQHPNIVQVYEVGQAQGVPYFSMEYCSGGALTRELAGTPQDAHRAAALLETLARAVHAAHQAKVVHRDLKPSNVLIVGQAFQADSSPAKDVRLESLTYKLTDFGLVKKLDEPGLTQTGNVLGTPSYMAPEQAGGQKDIGPPADIYSLGATLYEFLTGRPPFQGPTTIDTLLLVINEDPVPPSRLNPKVPRDLETICLQCLHKEPGRRYASALALADDLRAFQENRPISGRRTGRVERLMKWTRRQPGWAAVAALSAAVAVAATVAVPMYVINLNRGQVAERGRKEEARQKQQAKAGQWLAEGDGYLKEEGARGVDEAKKAFQKVLDVANQPENAADPDFAPIRARAVAKMSGLGEWKRAEATWKKFRGLRDEALVDLHQGLFGLVAAGGPALARRKAEEALALYDLKISARPRPRLPGLTVDDKKQVRQDLYEVALLLAEATAREKDPARALDVLDWAQTEEFVGETAAIYRRRARYLAQQGKPNQEELRKAETLPMSTPLERFLAGAEEAADATGDPKRAVEHLAHAINMNRGMFWAWFFQAVAYQRQSNHAEAIRSLTRCLDLDQQFIWGYLLRGYLRGQQSKAAARTSPERARQYRAAAEQDFDEAQRLRPNAAAWYVILVNRALLATGPEETARAVGLLGMAIDLRPDLFHARVNLAHVYRRQLQMKPALLQLDRAIACAKHEPALYQVLAQFRHDAGDLPGALNAIDDALNLLGGGGERASERTRYRLVRTVLLYKLARYGEAERECRVLLRSLDNADRQRKQIQYLLADSLLMLQRHQDARLEFDNYLRLAGSQSDAHAIYRRGLACAELKDYAAAVADYSLSLHIRSDHSAVLVARGWAHLAQEEFRAALSDFDRAIELNEKLASALAGRGLVLAWRGDLKEATRDATAALKQDRDNPHLLYEVARIYARCADTSLLRSDRSRRPDRRALDRREAVALLGRAAELTPAARVKEFWDRVAQDRAFHSLRDQLPRRPRPVLRPVPIDND